MMPNCHDWKGCLRNLITVDCGDEATVMLVSMVVEVVDEVGGMLSAKLSLRQITRQVARHWFHSNETILFASLLHSRDIVTAVHSAFSDLTCKPQHHAIGRPDLSLHC